MRKLLQHDESDASTRREVRTHFCFDLRGDEHVRHDDAELPANPLQRLRCRRGLANEWTGGYHSTERVDSSLVLVALRREAEHLRASLRTTG